MVKQKFAAYCKGCVCPPDFPVCVCGHTPEGRLVFNEVNTIPGCTPHSRFPAMLAAAGLSLPEVLERTIGEAVER